MTKNFKSIEAAVGYLNMMNVLRGRVNLLALVKGKRYHIAKRENSIKIRSKSEL